MNDLFWNRCKNCVRVYTNREGQVCCNWLNKPIKELHIKPDDDCDFIPEHSESDELKMNMEDGEIL